ncbi:MAG: response regulator [Spirochaetales bacterium]|nr:response regulator [Spirochaetales bacterium]
MDKLNVESGSRFLASTLHEVRTPIQTIISTTELLQDTVLDKEQTEYVHQIEFSANALLELANDVLDFTKIHSENFKLENVPFDIVELTERAVDLISIEAFNKNLEVITDIDYSIPNNVMGDPTRIQQIILNLVKNAVKFTSQGFVMIKLTYEKGYYLFEVIDSGIGVAEEKQKLIFKDFYQVDASTTRKFGGTGLGLAISKNLVGVMNGRIGILSNGKLGSNFWFTLPLEKSLFDEKKIPPFIIPLETKVLIVDNSNLTLKSLESKLRKFGFNNIEKAAGGKNALALMRQAARNGKPFTLAFIDSLMPEMDGWYLASEIKKDSSIKNAKLYLMVPEGQMGKEAKIKMLNYFNGYLYKPIKQNSLISLLKEMFVQNGGLEEEKVTIPKISTDDKVAEGLKILVAEDHPVNRKIIETFLKKFGAEVFLAADGEEAVQQIAAHPGIDLIFMDILMPVKTGIDATMELRKNNYNGIIIACTANNDPKVFETYKKLGINDILVKPFKREAIYQFIEKWKAVLSISDAKNMITLAYINSQSSDLWDLNDFMDTTGGSVEFAQSLMEEYIEQTEALLEKIKSEMDGEKKFSKLELYTHTLKGSSAVVSVNKLSSLGEKMNHAAKQKDLNSLEEFRIEFAIDFTRLKTLVDNWKNNLWTVR